MNSTQITTTAGSRRQPKSRMKEICVRGRGLPRSSANCSARTAKAMRDDGLADHLGLAAQAEAALLDDLDVVVEEADQAQPDEEEQHQQRRTRSARSSVITFASEVADQRGQDEDDAAHGGVPRLVWWLVGPSSRICWP